MDLRNEERLRLRSPDQPEQKAGTRRAEEVGSLDWGTHAMIVSET